MDDFDVAVIGTGLAESVAAAGLARAGKRVLHVDPAPRYGGSWSTLSVREADEIFASGSHAEVGGLSHFSVDGAENARTTDLAAVRVDPAVCGPAALQCAGEALRVLEQAGGAGAHLEWRPVRACLVFDHSDASLRKVPAARADIFSDGSLPPVTKRRLMRVLQALPVDLGRRAARGQPGALAVDALSRIKQEGLAASQPVDAAARGLEGTLPTPGRGVSEGEALPTALRTWLRETHGLDAGLADLLVHAVAGCDGSTDEAAVMEREEGISNMAMHLSALGTYAPSPFLMAVHGASELCQAFCRVAAVAGATYMLGQPIEGVRTSLGLDGHMNFAGLDLGPGGPAGPTAASVTARFLVAAPSFLRAHGLLSLGGAEAGRDSRPMHAAARAVYVLDGALCGGDLPGVVALVIPPNGLNPDMPARCVYGVQVDATTQLCPEGHYIVSLSSRVDAECSAADTSAQMRAALDALMNSRAPPNAVPTEEERGPDDVGNVSRGTRPATVLWSTFSILPLEGDDVIGGPANEKNALPAGVVALGRSPSVGIGSSVEDAVVRGRACVATICGPDAPFFPDPAT